jgi:O-antigen/teichoic acid export membrane protein
VAALVAFGLQAVNMVVAPHFARLHARGDDAALQQLVTVSARVIFFFTLPTATVFIVFGDELVRLIFGPEFNSGYLTLIILLIGQLMNASMGSVGLLLSMTGHERETARGVAVAAVSNLILNLSLIPNYGMEGAALASALSVAIWNVLLWRAARRRLGINSLAFGSSGLAS